MPQGTSTTAHPTQPEYLMNAQIRVPLWSLASLLLLLAGCAGSGSVASPGASPSLPLLGEVVEVPGGSYRAAGVEEFRQLMALAGAPLINVHIPFEGDLPGTTGSVAFNTIPAQLDQLPADRTAPILLYCRSGSMSARAATELVALGYTRVTHLTGGFNAWRAAGHPMAPE